MNHRTRNAINVAFWTLCIMGFFAILSSTMSKTLLNPFATILQTSTDWSGFIGAASTIPGILVSLPASSLSDIYGRKKFLLIAAIVFASAPFLYLFINIWWQLALVRFYHGFATAIFVPVAEAATAEMFPTKRGERISLFTGATYVGRGLAPILRRSNSVCHSHKQRPPIQLSHNVFGCWCCWICRINYGFNVPG